MIDTNVNFIVAAFAVTWVVLLGYSAHLLRRAARVRAGHARAVGGAEGATRT